MRSELNDGLIDIMAESIEVAVPEGDILIDIIHLENVFLHIPNMKD